MPVLRSCPLVHRGIAALKVWIVTIGEPVPVHPNCRDRLHRSGSLARYLAGHGHSTTWWTSTFDHFRKQHWFAADQQLVTEQGLVIELLNGGGYRSNISWARWSDHRHIASKFARRAREAEKPDIVLTSLPTLELCAESVRLGRECSVPVVLDMRDMWPDLFVEAAPRPLQSLARMVLDPMFRQAAKSCSEATAITGITDAFVDWGLRRGNRERTAWDRSFPFGYSAQPPTPAALEGAETFWDERGITRQKTPWVACFFGTFGRQLDIRTVILAARECHRRNVPIHFVLCGNGDHWENFRRLAQGLPNVTLPGWVDAAAIHVLMRRSQVGLDPLPNIENFLANINNKAVEYFSAGLPVLSSPDTGVLARLLAAEGAGLSHAHGDVSELCRLLTRLYENPNLVADMRRQSQQLFNSRFESERVHREMADYLQLVAERHSHPFRTRCLAAA